MRINIMFNQFPRLNFQSKFKKKADDKLINKLILLFNNYSCDRYYNLYVYLHRLILHTKYKTPTHNIDKNSISFK
jgi:hypothetical protein